MLFASWPAGRGDKINEHRRTRRYPPGGVCLKTCRAKPINKLRDCVATPRRGENAYRGVALSHTKMQAASIICLVEIVMTLRV